MHTCRLCFASISSITHLGEFAIVNQLVSRGDAAPRKYPLQVAICSQCALIQLVDVIPSEYFYRNYPTPSSWKPEPHLPKLVNYLSALPNRSELFIVDVGCNDGKFLESIKDLGFGRLMGIEPTANTAEAALQLGFEVVNDFLRPNVVDGILRSGHPADIVVSRQVLEHIEDLETWMLSASALLAPDGLLVLELPDATAMLNFLDMSLWEEHVNYFTHQTLEYLLARHGFIIEDFWYSRFSGVCLTIVARRAPSRKQNQLQIALEGLEVEAALALFASWLHLRPEVAHGIRAEVETHASGKAYLYGVGARSSMAINLLDITDLVEFAVDDNPAKQGKSMPNGLIPILSSGDSQLASWANHLCLLGMNGENEDIFIKQSAVAQKVLSVLPPSSFLPESWTEAILKGRPWLTRTEIWGHALRGA